MPPATRQEIRDPRILAILSAYWVLVLFPWLARCDKLGAMQAYVLVVDDDEAVRNFIASLLSEEGYPVRSAGDASSRT